MQHSTYLMNDCAVRGTDKEQKMDTVSALEKSAGWSETQGSPGHCTERNRRKDRCPRCSQVCPGKGNKLSQAWGQDRVYVEFTPKGELVSLDTWNITTCTGIFTSKNTQKEEERI